MLTVLIRYCWLACALLLFPIFTHAFAQEAGPELLNTQTGGRTVLILPVNWTVYATNAEITLTSSAHLEKVTAPDWWNTTIKENTVTLTMIENVAKSSKFFIETNSTSSSYNYEITLNGTKYDGNIAAKARAEDTKFSKWIDPTEKAATAFVPEGWSADLQIIRPYKSMTGFVFFARGSDNTLVYLFQPLMPMHLLPSNSLCDDAELCSGTISAEKVREMSLGNAPIEMSDLKTPQQYFAEEVLPTLRKNLYAYTITLQKAGYALSYGTNSTEMVPDHQVEYSFNVDDKKITGTAVVLVRNYTAGDTGVWNGFIVGVESSEKNFGEAMKHASVMLLTLQFEKEWLAAERKVLLDNANVTGALGTIPVVMANKTLLDFNVVVPTAAHKMVRTYNDTMIGGYLESSTQEELHLPLFPDTQQWYISGDQLVGRRGSLNAINSTSLQPLF